MIHKTTSRFSAAAFSMTMLLGIFGNHRIEAAISYIAYDLTPNGYSQSRGYDLDGNTQVGCARIGSNGLRAMLWRGSADSAVNLHYGNFTDSWAVGARENYQFGYGYYYVDTYNSGYHALYWQGTAESMVDINPNGMVKSQIFGVGETQEVGWGCKSGSAYHALIWNGATKSVTDINPSGIYESAAVAISGGTQVGYGSTSNWVTHAYLWLGTAASAVDLNPSGLEESFALDVSGSQQVGYGCVYANLNAHALLWTGTALSCVDLNPTGFASSCANGTNGSQQVGYGLNENTFYRPHALVWNGDKDHYLDLHQYVPAGFSDSQAMAIDNQGNIFGFAATGGGVEHAILWVPVPEPSAIALLLAAALGGLIWRCRRVAG